MPGGPFWGRWPSTLPCTRRSYRGGWRCAPGLATPRSCPAAWPLQLRGGMPLPTPADTRLVCLLGPRLSAWMGAGRGTEVNPLGSNVHLASVLCTCLSSLTWGKSTNLSTCCAPALSWADTAGPQSWSPRVCGRDDKPTGVGHRSGSGKCDRADNKGPFQVRWGLGFYSECGGSPWRRERMRMVV